MKLMDIMKCHIQQLPDGFENSSYGQESVKVVICGKYINLNKTQIFSISP